MAGILLPTLCGVIWLQIRPLRPAEIGWPTLLGYGYLSGALATTLLMRLLDLVGIRLGFIAIALSLVCVTAVGFALGHRTWPTPGISQFGRDWRSFNTQPKWHKIAYAFLLALIVVRFGGLALELVWRPLFPWDAWSQWATKARVWYEFGHLVPFVAGDVWLSGKLPGAYTDLAPHYPPAIPLLQVWMSYCLGRWDDALMNLPWLACAIALGLAFYGQLRRWEVSPVIAMMFTYFLLSLPMLDTHVALAGYADLFMAAFYGLAAMAFFHWSKTRSVWQGIVAILFGLGCIFIKQPGLVWLLTFVPAVLVVLMPRRGVMMVTILGLAGLLGLVMLAQMGTMTLFSYNVSLQYASAWLPLWQNLFILDNWHLLWYFLFAAMALALPKLLLPRLRGITTLVFTGFAFLGVAFFFTQAQAWAEDFTTVNRALLHMAPVLMFYIVVLWREAAWRPFSTSNA